MIPSFEAFLQRSLRLRELRAATAQPAPPNSAPSSTAVPLSVTSSRQDWGDFARSTPFSDVWGMDRGRCIDRWYIEGFLANHVADIHGHVLEINDPGYAVAFGAGRTSRIDVIDIDPANPQATITADLRNVQSVADDTFDCIILTQTIHIIYEAEAVVRECARMLKPRGVLLATLPCASRLAPEQGLDRDYWRFTKSSVVHLFGEAHPWAALAVEAHGNFAVNVAFLYGLACHELAEAAFEPRDRTPLIISVRAEKPSEGLHP